MIHKFPRFIRGAALLPSLAAGAALLLNGCSTFGGDDAYISPPSAASERAQVTPLGQTQTPPATAATAVIGPDDQIVQHTVVTGDSLWKIARDYKTTVEKIKVANQLTSDTILAGQVLNVPTKSPPAGATATPSPQAGGTPAADPSRPAPQGQPQPQEEQPATTPPAATPVFTPYPSAQPQTPAAPTPPPPATGEVAP